MHILEYLLKNICFSNEISDAPVNMHIMENSKLSDQNIHFLSKDIDLKCNIDKITPTKNDLKNPKIFSALRARNAQNLKKNIFRDPHKICIFWIWRCIKNQIFSKKKQKQYVQHTFLITSDVSQYKKSYVLHILIFS